MKVSKTELFPTNVYVFDNVLEEEYIDSMKEDIIKRTDSNFQENGGQDDSSGDLQLRPKYKALADAVKDGTKYVLNNLMYEYDDFAITGMWSTVLTQNSIHRPHTHSNNMLSGVYYVQSDKDANAKIHFYDPRPQADIISPHVKKLTRENGHVWFWPSIVNRMIIFPSWLQHYVEPNPSETPRISIAFNMQLKGRVGQMSDYQSAEF